MHTLLLIGVPAIAGFVAGLLFGQGLKKDAQAVEADVIKRLEEIKAKLEAAKKAL
jgi:hypothetical protein